MILIAYLQVVKNIIKAKAITFGIKNSNKKLKTQLKVVKASFTCSNITKYSGLNNVPKYMNRQNIVKSIRSAFPTRWHNATRYQELMAITQSLIGGISWIAAFSGDGLEGIV